MHVFNKGDAWYFRKTVLTDSDGRTRRKDFAVGSFGSCLDLKARAKAKGKAQAAAQKLWPELEEAYKAQRAVEKAAPTLVSLKRDEADAKKDLPFPTYCQDVYTKTYSTEKGAKSQGFDARTIATWAAIYGDKKLMGQITEADNMAGLKLRRASYTAHNKRKKRTLLKEASVQKEVALLHAIFETAIVNRHIKRSPWNAGRGKHNPHKPAGYSSPTRAHRILTPEDEVKLMAACATTRRDARGRMVCVDPRIGRFIQFLLETALRLDELVNDAFEDHGSYVTVCGKFGKVRNVVLTRKARRILDEQWADPGDPRFPRPKGGAAWWQTQAHFRDVMNTLCHRAGILHLSPHDLRHTFGHRFLVRGGRMKALSLFLGHASMAVTEKHYGYLREEDVAAHVLDITDPGRPAAPALAMRPARQGRRLRRVK